MKSRNISHSLHISQNTQFPELALLDLLVPLLVVMTAPIAATPTKNIRTVLILIAHGVRLLQSIRHCCILIVLLCGNDSIERAHNNLVKRLVMRKGNNPDFLGKKRLRKSNLDRLVIGNVAIIDVMLNPLSVSLRRTIIQLKLGNKTGIIHKTLDISTTMTLRTSIHILIDILKLHRLGLHHKTRNICILWKTNTNSESNCHLRTHRTFIDVQNRFIRILVDNKRNKIVSSTLVHIVHIVEIAVNTDGPALLIAGLTCFVNLPRPHLATTSLSDLLLSRRGLLRTGKRIVNLILMKKRTRNVSSHWHLILDSISPIAKIECALLGNTMLLQLRNKCIKKSVTTKRNRGAIG